MADNNNKGPDLKKSKKDRDKRAKGKNGLGRLFKGAYYLTNKTN